MCWLLRPRFNQWRNTAPHHCIRLTRLQSLRPQMNLSTIEGWETPLTTTHENTFYSEDEPRRVHWDISSSETFDSNKPRQVSITSRPSSTPPPPRRQKRKLGMGISSPKKGECHSTPARQAANPYQHERHPDAQIN